MSNPIDVRVLAKRVVGRILAERGQEERPERTAGVFVTVEPGGEPLRPEVAVARPGPRHGPELVTADLLAKLGRGGTLRIPRGAIVIDLARQEAWRRGITFHQGDTTDAGAPLAACPTFGILTLRVQLRIPS